MPRWFPLTVTLLFSASALDMPLPMRPVQVAPVQQVSLALPGRIQLERGEQYSWASELEVDTSDALALTVVPGAELWFLAFTAQGLELYRYQGRKRQAIQLPALRSITLNGELVRLP